MSLQEDAQLLRLFQPAVCPGHKSADRCIARKLRHLDGALRRQPWQPLGRLPRHLPPRASRRPDAHARRVRPSVLNRPRRVQDGALQLHLSAQRCGGRARRDARLIARERGGGRARRREPDRAVRSRGRGGSPHPESSFARRGAQPPDQRGPAHRRRFARGDRRRDARARFRLLGGLFRFGHLPVHGARVHPRSVRARRARRGRRHRCRELRQGGHRGHYVHHVEDGHLHDAGLPFRADLRDLGTRRRVRRRVLHPYVHAHRRTWRGRRTARAERALRQGDRARQDPGARPASLARCDLVAPD